MSERIHGQALVTITKYVDVDFTDDGVHDNGDQIHEFILEELMMMSDDEMEFEMLTGSEIKPNKAQGK